MFKERTFDSGGVTINYAEGPESGPTLVLLHEGSRRWQHLLPILPTLVLRWHVYALDLRGHGKSGRAQGRYCPVDYASDVKAFLESQVAEPAAIFGHSMGAWFALMAAAEVPDKVCALVLGDPALDVERWAAIEGTEDRIGMYTAMRNLAASELTVAEIVPLLANLPIAVPGSLTPVRYGDMPFMDGARLRSRAKALSQLDPDVARYHAEGRMADYMHGMDLDAAMRRVTCPVLIVQADPNLGGALTDSDVNHAAASFADARYVKLVGTPHDLGFENWQVTPLLRAMVNFLESL